VCVFVCVFAVLAKQYHDTIELLFTHLKKENSTGTHWPCKRSSNNTNVDAGGCIFSW